MLFEACMYVWKPKKLRQNDPTRRIQTGSILKYYPCDIYLQKPDVYANYETRNAFPVQGIYGLFYLPNPVKTTK